MFGKNDSASIEEKIYKEILGSNKKNKKEYTQDISNN